MKTAEELSATAEWGRLTEEDLSSIVNGIKRCKPGDSKDLYPLLHALGSGACYEYRTLIEKFINYPSDSQVAGAALTILGFDWGLASDYLDQIKMFIKGVDWDYDEARFAAINCAGEYLSQHEDSELLQLLLNLYEKGTGDKDLDDLMKEVTYPALSRAVGKERKEIHTAKEFDESVLERAHLRLQGKYKIKVTLKSEVMQKAEALLEIAKWSQLSEENVTYIIQRMKECKPGDDEDLPNLIQALRFGKHLDRKLIEKFLHFPSNPRASFVALASLCDREGSETNYLTQIKKFIRGLDWDNGHLKLLGMFYAGEYLRHHEDSEFFELIINLYEKGAQDEKFEWITRETAYQAMARAAGKSWREIANTEEHDEVVIKQAYQRLKNK